MSPSAVLWDADGVLQRVPDGGEESMLPAVEARVEDLDGFLAETALEERPALRGEARWLDLLPGLLRAGASRGQAPSASVTPLPGLGRRPRGGRPFTMFTW